MITDKIGRRFGWKMGNVGCGVQSAGCGPSGCAGRYGNAECGKLGVWKMENAEYAEYEK